MSVFEYEEAYQFEDFEGSLHLRSGYVPEAQRRLNIAAIFGHSHFIIQNQTQLQNTKISILNQLILKQSSSKPSTPPPTVQQQNLDLQNPA